MSEESDSEPGTNEVQQEPKLRAPLMTAIKSGDIGELRWLLSREADVNSPGRKMLLTLQLPEVPSYPLLWAIQSENSQAVQLLLGAGADPNICCNYECESHAGSLRPLCMAVRTGKPDVVDMLLNAGAEVNAQQQTAYQSETALLIAVPSQPHLVEVLIERGADVNMTDESGCGALHHAVITYNQQLAARLIEVGAEVNQSLLVSAITPLMLALGTKAPPSLVQLLLESRADPHLRDAYGRSALHWAAKELNVWAIKWLIGQNVDLETRMQLRGEPISAFHHLFEACYQTFKWRFVDYSRCVQRLRAMKVLALAGARLVTVTESPSDRLNRARLLEKLNWFVSRSEGLLSTPENRTSGMTDDTVQEIRDIVHTLTHILSNPVSLSDACRLQIRRILGRDFRNKLQQLNLPVPLQDYLVMYKDWDIAV